MTATDRDALAVRWPQFALAVDVDGVRLHAPTDDQLGVLAERASQPGAVLPTGQEHFVKWLGGRTSDQIAVERTARVRSNRDLARRPGWTLDLAVMIDDAPVGLQSVSGFDAWPHRRVVGTTSWLLSSFQGRGIGTRSRAAVLELAFTYLGVESAKTWVLEDNRASIAVSSALGYRLIDRHTITEDDCRYTEEVHQLDRDAWLHAAARSRYQPSVVGVQPLVDLLQR